MRYRKPEELKAAETDLLRDIPSEWRGVRLKFLYSMEKGNGFSEYYDTKDNLEEKLLPYLSMEYLRCEDNNLYVNSNEEHTLVKNEDTLLLWDGSNAGEFIKGKYGALSTTLSKLSIIRHVEKSYSFYILKTIEKIIKDNTVGMGIPHVDPNYIKSTVLPLPPKCEQRTIAAFLDRKTEAIDGLIEKKEQLIERLKEKRQALITKAVTKALDDNAPMKNLGVEWLGEIPKDWEVTLFKRGFHVQLGKMLQNNKKSQNESQEYYLRAANIQWNDVNTGYLKKMWFNTEEKRKYNLKEGDLLVSEGGDVGRASIWHNEIEECYFQNAINRVRAKNLNRNKFAYYWIFFLKHAGYIDMICSKATISHLTAEKLENLPLLLPPVKEQISIIEELDHNLNKMRNIKSAIAEQIKKLKEYRQSLISAAVTGKIDVRDEMEVESKKMMI